MALADPTPAFARANPRPGPDVAAQVARLRALLATYGCPIERFGDLVTPRAEGTMGFGRPHAVVGIRCWAAGANEIRISSAEPDGSILTVWVDRDAFEPWSGEGAPVPAKIPRCTTEGAIAMRDALVAAVMAGEVSLARYDLCRDHLRRAGHDVRIKPYDEAFVAAAAIIEDRARRATVVTLAVGLVEVALAALAPLAMGTAVRRFLFDDVVEGTVLVGLAVVAAFALVVLDAARRGAGL